MSDGESIAGREREVTFHTSGALTREQVEEVFNAVYWHGDQQGAKQCKVLDGIDALRATIEQQAQELEGQAARIDALRTHLSATITERDNWETSADEAMKELKEARQQLAASQARCREMEARKDAAYLERNQVVAALAKCFPSGIRKTAIEGWSDDWHGCVYIDLPAGQISYHYHDAQADLFFGLPAYDKPYDGHTKEQVHDRLQSAQLQATLAARELTWTTARPTVAGGYWVKRMFGGYPEYNVMDVTEHGTIGPYHKTLDECIRWQFAGPIPLPTEPQQARGSSGGAANQGAGT